MLLDLNGMFSFVIYDKKNNILFGAVDRFSIKPLYYTINKNLFSFSSEIKPLLEINTISKNYVIIPYMTIFSYNMYHLKIQFMKKSKN